MPPRKVIAGLSAGSLAAAALAATAVIRKHRSGGRLGRADRRVISQLLSALKAAQAASEDTTGQVAETTQARARSLWAILRVRSGESAPLLLQRLIERFVAGDLPDGAAQYVEDEVNNIRRTAEETGM